MKWRAKVSWRWAVFFSLSVLFFTLGLAQATRADTIVQGFKAKGNLQPGIIVSLVGNNSDTVQSTTGNQSNEIYGVVIDPSQAPVTLQQQGQQVFVANGGDYPVLVSTQSGAIKAGDYISISSVDGIGAKAQNQSIILGRALESFDGKSNVITTTAEGQAIGRVDVNIAPGKNPLAQAGALPAPLQKFGQSVAGKSISAPRIYGALVVFLITSTVALSILVVGVKSSITAIGRNPLSKRSILKGLSQVTMVSLLVFIAGTFAVYLLLKV